MSNPIYHNKVLHHMYANCPFFISILAVSILLGDHDHLLLLLTIASKLFIPSASDSNIHGSIFPRCPPFRCFYYSLHLHDLFNSKCSFSSASLMPTHSSSSLMGNLVGWWMLPLSPAKQFAHPIFLGQAVAAGRVQRRWWPGSSNFFWSL